MVCAMVCFLVLPALAQGTGNKLPRRGGLAVAIAGLWYLPELRFVFTVSSVAMGDDRGALKPGS